MIFLPILNDLVVGLSITLHFISITSIMWYYIHIIYKYIYLHIIRLKFQLSPEKQVLVLQKPPIDLQENKMGFLSYLAWFRF